MNVLNKKFYITTPIYYPSGKFHIGTAYSTLLADAIKRYKVLRGYDSYMLTGVDEHGQKVEKVAEGRGITPQEHVDQIAALQVKGLIILGNDTIHRRPLPKSITLGLPTVYAYSPVADCKKCSVITDDEAVGRMAIDRLFSMGRRQIVVIAGDEYSQATRDRIQGCLKQFQQLSIKPVKLLYDSWTMEWGWKSTLMLLEQKQDFDGIYCLGDGIALGAIAALQSRGVPVPSAVSVIGTGNDIGAHAQLHPLISTIDINVKQVGCTAASLLTDSINGNPHPGIHMVPPIFINRESL